MQELLEVGRVDKTELNQRYWYFSKSEVKVSLKWLLSYKSTYWNNLNSE